MKSKRRQINVAPALPTPLGLFCFLFELLDIQPIAFTTEIHTTGGKDKRGRYGRDFPSHPPAQLSCHLFVQTLLSITVHCKSFIFKQFPLNCQATPTGMAISQMSALLLPPSSVLHYSVKAWSQPRWNQPGLLSINPQWTWSKAKRFITKRQM